jgi:ketosteroid isomerase-like protein
MFFQEERVMKAKYSVALAIVCFALAGGSQAATEENAEDFMGIHKIEIVFHEAGTTKNLDLMLSLFADDATLTSGGKTYKGKEEVRSYWQAAGPFQPQNQWVAYTPAFRIKYTVEGDRAHLYFECLYVDKAKNSIAAHTNSDDGLVRVNGKWLIEEMKASAVPEL